jgi:hypothetical protein
MLPEKLKLKSEKIGTLQNGFLVLNLLWVFVTQAI